MIGIDVAMYDAYGNWFSGLKPLVQNSMRTIMKANPAMYVLRERIGKVFRYTSRISRSRSSIHRTTRAVDVKLFVDDKNVYRVAVHRTLEGNVATEVINGCVFTLNPKMGHLIIHTSVWAGQKRLSQLAKGKTV